MTAMNQWHETGGYETSFIYSWLSDYGISGGDITLDAPMFRIPFGWLMTSHRLKKHGTLQRLAVAGSMLTLTANSCMKTWRTGRRRHARQPVRQRLLVTVSADCPSAMMTLKCTTLSLSRLRRAC